MTLVHLSFILEKLGEPQTYFWIYLCFYSCVTVFPKNPNEKKISVLPPIHGSGKKGEDEIPDSVA